MPRCPNTYELPWQPGETGRDRRSSGVYRQQGLEAGFESPPRLQCAFHPDGALRAADGGAAVPDGSLGEAAERLRAEQKEKALKGWIVLRPAAREDGSVMPTRREFVAAAASAVIAPSPEFLGRSPSYCREKASHRMADEPAPCS